MSVITSLAIPNRGPVVQPDFHIRPEHIVLKNISREVFGDGASATAAYILVKWAVANGGWRPFTMAEIQQFYKELRTSKKKKLVNPGMFYFEALIEPRRRPGLSGRLEIFGGGWIVYFDNRYRFTEAFVRACYCPRRNDLDKKTGPNLKILARQDVKISKLGLSPASRRRRWS